MQEKKINPWIKMALELGPIILFFVTYIRIRDQSFTIGGTEYEGFIIIRDHRQGNNEEHMKQMNANNFSCSPPRRLCSLRIPWQ